MHAVKRVKAGVSPEVVVGALGCHRSAIYKRMAAYREGGIATLKGSTGARCQA